MMSSCCTLRLKRRSAFSRDSPSCNLTSAKETTPPNLSGVDSLFIARFATQVKGYVGLKGGRDGRRTAGEGAGATKRRLKNSSSAPTAPGGEGRNWWPGRGWSAPENGRGNS